MHYSNILRDSRGNKRIKDLVLVATLVQWGNRPISTQNNVSIRSIVNIL